MVTSGGGKLFLTTTLHEKSEEGFFIKVDYQEKLERFRRKYTETELCEFIQSENFNIIEKLYTNEADRNKKWILLICSKT